MLQAYDERLRLACSDVGVSENLAPLVGLDRDLERLRVEYIVSNIDSSESGSATATERPTSPSARTPIGDGSLFRPAAPSHLAVILVKMAINLLSVSDRPRYLEEFLGELFELAATGSQPGEQLSYAVRLLRRMPALRKELGSSDDDAD
ncbi:hypothetical protein AB0J83_35620 [Actinoplanes sp. NPDC049596]|uniref:hypothetical protein n=1 Tax=unclassified Actinoplanes TaxID=2626549 RepID=UPI0034372077